MLVPFVPSPPEVIVEMLKCANASSEDIVIDFGCGDGRVLKIAKEQFKVKMAIGIELDKNLCKEAKTLDTEVICGDMITLADILIPKATIITAYLSTRVNSIIEDYIIKYGKQGLRVISHDFEFNRLKLYKKVNVKAMNLLGETEHVIYCYKL